MTATAEKPKKKPHIDLIMMLIAVPAFVGVAIMIGSLISSSLDSKTNQVVATVYANMQTTYYDKEGHYGTIEELVEAKILTAKEVEKYNIETTLNNEGNKWLTISYEQPASDPKTKEKCIITPSEEPNGTPNMKCKELDFRL